MSTTADAGRTAEKIAPVQGYSAGIPWSMHLRAYDAYCKKYGPQKALIDLEGRGCRGGFGVGELDMFIPGWREELSKLHQLRRCVADLANAAELFTAATHEVRDLLNGKDIACPSSIMLATEKARVALAAAKAVQ